DGGDPADGGAPADPWACGPPLGARLHPDGDLEVRVHAPNATRVELALFAAPIGETERLRLPLERDADGRFALRVEAAALEEAELPGADGALYYGLRAWGPNWPFDPAWEPGTETGRVADVDAAGHRMNPNKLLIDPYALELSHDPIGPAQRDYGPFLTDPDNRARDSAPNAPKGVVVACAPGHAGPPRALHDDVVYEVHLRGFTMADPSVPEAERGTYAGAARKARWLAELGVTAIELLPLHETPNDQNPLTPDAAGDNYWGYSSLSYFAPDRRYAADRSPGGPTRELRAMVEAFHAEGIKVFVDVVYNHTAEGGARGGAATILSWRGLDNAGFYALAEDPADYVNSNGVGPNVNTAEPLAQELVLASLRYWHEELGVDGFRFDLASVVANGCARACYRFDRAFPERIAAELARPAAGGPGVDLIAEAWGTAPGTYQVGHFPAGWASWNDRYRDALRRDLNRLGREALPLRELLRRLSGSPDLYEDDGRTPGASVNFVVAHDGLTLHDLFRHDGKDNAQPWPWGPSDGGTDNDLASSHGGDPARQATVTRTAMALLALSAGVPMFNGGDESGRTLRANNNPYNIDSEANWLRWPGDPLHDAELEAFTARLFAFRAAHAALRPARHWRVFGDADGDGLTEVRWFRDDGAFVDDAYLDAGDRHFVAWQLDGDELGDEAASLFFAYNGWDGTIRAAVPAAPEGTRWRRVMDTSAAGEGFGWVREGGAAGEVVEGPVDVAGRSVVGLVAR
ncbi:MAG TPA: alpha-amylase family glycosyl hydrolase, partial [Polyangiaceae bacterium LLY-WYZ-15_(1-7)]|nr:alpha-amylase family glycosyl hydrolase [Polyangiaceae bacterium LLY-WYZ-15_(1-7)]